MLGYFHFFDLFPERSAISIVELWCQAWGKAAAAGRDTSGSPAEAIMPYLVPYFPVTPTSAIIVSTFAAFLARCNVTDSLFASSCWRMFERRYVGVGDGLNSVWCSQGFQCGRCQGWPSLNPRKSWRSFTYLNTLILLDLIFLSSLRCPLSTWFTHGNGFSKV